MGALGQLFGVLFGRLLTFFGTYITGRLLIFATAVTAFLTMLAGLTVAFNAALNSIAMVMPSEYQWGLGIIPTNIPTCVSVILMARVTLWVFHVKWAIVKIKMQG